MGYDYQFGPFRLDVENERLWRGREQIILRPKSFAVLRYLVAQPRQLVTRDEILEAVWRGIAVTDAVLTVCIGEIRQALGDDRHRPRYIETVHRRGYRFIGADRRRTRSRRHSRCRPGTTGGRPCIIAPSSVLRPPSCSPRRACSRGRTTRRLAGASTAGGTTGRVRRRGARHRQDHPGQCLPRPSPLTAASVGGTGPVYRPLWRR